MYEDPDLWTYREPPQLAEMTPSGPETDDPPTHPVPIVSHGWDAKRRPWSTWSIGSALGWTLIGALGLAGGAFLTVLLVGLLADQSYTDTSELDAAVEQGATAVGSIPDNSYVVQLSARMVNMESIAGPISSPESVLRGFQSLQAQYPDARLVRSEDYPTFTKPGFYVTIVATPHSTLESAEAWCMAHEMDYRVCFARPWPGGAAG